MQTINAKINTVCTSRSGSFVCVDTWILYDCIILQSYYGIGMSLLSSFILLDRSLWKFNTMLIGTKGRLVLIMGDMHFCVSEQGAKMVFSHILM